MTYNAHERATRNMAILRARAERYRRLANELFDARTSQEAASLADEIDAEIARLQAAPHTSRSDRSEATSSDCTGTVFAG